MAGSVAPLNQAQQEQRWLRAAQAGDSFAFAKLVRLHQARIRAVLRRLCQGESARADELAQEAFLQAWQALPGFRGEAAFATWLYRLAYHAFLQDQRRAGQQVIQASVAWTEEKTRDGSSSAGANSNPGLQPVANSARQIAHDASVEMSAAAISGAATEHSADQTAWRLDLQAALDALPAGEREAIIHVEWAGLSHAEAAEVLERPLGTIKTQVLRGKERMRQRLAAYAPSSSAKSATSVSPQETP